MLELSEVVISTYCFMLPSRCEIGYCVQIFVMEEQGVELDTDKFVYLFDSYLDCSGIIPGSVLKHHSWLCLGGPSIELGFKPALALGKASTLP